MDGTNRHEAGGACASAHAPQCPHCHREVTPNQCHSLECVVCGAAIEHNVHVRGRRPLTCGNELCRGRLALEHARAKRRRRAALMNGRDVSPGVCRGCFYTRDLCRCDGTNRNRVS